MQRQATCGQGVGAAVLALLFVVVTAPVSWAQSAGDRLFTIAKYPVEATSSNAVAAKREAIDKGRRAAFRSLLKRLVPASSQAMIKQIEKVDPKPYVSGMRVLSEENSRTQYIATLDFSFDAEAVRSLLGQHGVPYVDQAAPTTNLLLIYSAPAGASGAMSETRGGRSWRSVWAGLDLANSVAPVRLVRKSGQLGADTLDALRQADAQALAKLGSDYQTSQIVIAEARPDPKSKTLAVTVAGQDAVSRFTVTTQYGLDSDFIYSLELAAVIAQGVLEGRWKTDQSGGAGGVMAAAGGAPTPLQILVEFSNLGQWQRQQQVLSSTRGVRNMKVGSLSGRSASVSLVFPGGGEALQAAVGPRGLTLENINGFWILR